VPGREVTQLLGISHPVDRASSPRNLRGFRPLPRQSERIGVIGPASTGVTVE